LAFYDHATGKSVGPWDIANSIQVGHSALKTEQYGHTACPNWVCSTNCMKAKHRVAHMFENGQIGFSKATSLTWRIPAEYTPHFAWTDLQLRPVGVDRLVPRENPLFKELGNTFAALREEGLSSLMESNSTFHRAKIGHRFTG
jgi:hypothetical protein